MTAPRLLRPYYHALGPELEPGITECRDVYCIQGDVRTVSPNLDRHR